MARHTLSVPLNSRAVAGGPARACSTDCRAAPIRLSLDSVLNWYA